MIYPFLKAGMPYCLVSAVETTKKVIPLGTARTYNSAAGLLRHRHAIIPRIVSHVFVSKHKLSQIRLTALHLLKDLGYLWIQQSLIHIERMQIRPLVLVVDLGGRGDTVAEFCLNVSRVCRAVCIWQDCQHGRSIRFAPQGDIFLGLISTRMTLMFIYGPHNKSWDQTRQGTVEWGSYSHVVPKYAVIPCIEPLH